MGDEGRGYSGNDWQGWAAEARTRRTDKTARSVHLKKRRTWFSRIDGVWNGGRGGNGRGVGSG